MLKDIHLLGVDDHEQNSGYSQIPMEDLEPRTSLHTKSKNNKNTFNIYPIFDLPLPYQLSL